MDERKGKRERGQGTFLREVCGAGWAVGGAGLARGIFKLAREKSEWRQVSQGSSVCGCVRVCVHVCVWLLQKQRRARGADEC